MSGNWGLTFVGFYPTLSYSVSFGDREIERELLFGNRGAAGNFAQPFDIAPHAAGKVRVEPNNLRVKIRDAFQHKERVGLRFAESFEQAFEIRFRK